MWNSGQLDARLDVARQAMELLAPYENVRFYYFHNFRDVVCDLDNYKDYNHYSAEISRRIVDWMLEGKGLVTPENREELLADTREMALSFDYGSLS